MLFLFIAYPNEPYFCDCFYLNVRWQFWSYFRPLLNLRGYFWSYFRINLIVRVTISDLGPGRIFWRSLILKNSKCSFGRFEPENYSEEKDHQKLFWNKQNGASIIFRSRLSMKVIIFPVINENVFFQGWGGGQFFELLPPPLPWPTNATTSASASRLFAEKTKTPPLTPPISFERL